MKKKNTLFFVQIHDRPYQTHESEDSSQLELAPTEKIVKQAQLKSTMKKEIVQ